jgi:ATP adenylyltransferase
MKKDDIKFVNVDSTKYRPDEVYGSVIEKIQKDGVCPFCPEQLATYHKNPILISKKHWLATENMYPYKGVKYHFLLIHKKHLSHINELSPEAWQELHEVTDEICAEYKIEGGSFLMRFGDSRFTGASVTHLHAHIISAEPNPERQPIMTRVG